MMFHKTDEMKCNTSYYPYAMMFKLLPYTFRLLRSLIILIILHKKKKISFHANFKYFSTFIIAKYFTEYFPIYSHSIIWRDYNIL